jgi:hypothetical protein
MQSDPTLEPKVANFFRRKKGFKKGTGCRRLAGKATRLAGRRKFPHPAAAWRFLSQTKLFRTARQQQINNVSSIVITER